MLRTFFQSHHITPQKSLLKTIKTTQTVFIAQSSININNTAVSFLCYYSPTSTNCSKRVCSTKTSTTYFINEKNNNIFLNTNNNNKMSLTLETLSRQDDVTSGLVLKLLIDNENFKALSATEGKLLITRDQEDEDKLAKGIEISVKKGVLKANPDVAPIQKINVLGKSADQVADEIFAKLPGGDEASVLVLQGLSGTGKGTTVAKLKSRLNKCICWSNGNVFRAATYMVNQSLKEGQEFSAEVLTPDLLRGIFGRLSFKRFGDTFDVVIDDTIRVGDIANTLLKEPDVSKRVPTVAEQTQGEVVLFAAAAIDILRQNGHNVILEGRAQTLNHIPTPHRFELVIPDVTILGSRRAAQRVMAAALDKIKDKKDASVEDVQAACVEVANVLK